jgi:hypothetical protein
VPPEQGARGTDFWISLLRELRNLGFADGHDQTLGRSLLKKIDLFEGKQMKILLISTSFNSFTQRASTDLIGAGHEVSVELPLGPDAMCEAADLFDPDLILCPFLKQRVPEDGFSAIVATP